jgi:localization factor PodJL
MGALDRLDQQVQGLAGDEDYADEYERAPSRSHRAGRYAIDALDEPDAYGDDDGYYNDDPYADADYGDEDDVYYQRAPRRSSIASRNASMHAYKDLGRRIDALRKPQEQALAHVREELGSLRDALGGISRGTNDTVNRQNTELRRLADMVDRLRNDKKNDQLAKEIRKEVAELKSLVGRTNVEGALQTLEHGYAHILQRLDELSRASVDPRVPAQRHRSAE